MKKIKLLSLLSALGIFSLVLASCGGNATPSTTKQDPTTNPSVTPTSAKSDPEPSKSTPSTTTSIPTSSATPTSSTPSTPTSSVIPTSSTPTTTSSGEIIFVPPVDLHNLTHVDEVDATCTEGGQMEHWYCIECGRYFTSEDAIDEIEDITTSPLGHDLSYVAQVDQTCLEDGVLEHYHCSRCEKNFSDSNGEFELSDIDMVLSKTGHNYIASEANVTFNEDNSKATLTIICQNDRTHTLTLDATTTSERVEPGCTTKGKITYKAVFEADAVNELTGTTTLSTPLEAIKEVELEATGHTYSELWSSNSDGHWHDATCGHQEITGFEAHSYGEWSETPATSSEAGSKTRTCSVCEYVDEVIIPAYLGFDLLNDDTYSVTLALENGECVLVKYEVPKDIVIPEEYNGKKVTVVRNLNNSYIESIYVSKNITDFMNGSLNENLKKLIWDTDLVTSTTIFNNVFKNLALDEIHIGTNGNFVMPSTNAVFITDTKKFSAEDDAKYHTVKDDMLFNKDGSTLLSSAALKEVEKLDLSKYEGLTSLARAALYKTTASEITLPEGLITIGIAALQRAVNLTELTIPQNVKTIGDSAFNGCTSLTKVYWFANECTKAFESYAIFEDCTSLTDLVIGDETHTVKSLPDSAFRLAKKVNKVTIYEGLEAINGGAFAYCESLKELVLPSSVTTIISGAFNGVTLDKLTAYAESFPVAKAKEVIVSGGIELGKKAFYGDESLTTITLPDTLTSIGEDAFRGCKNLASIAIPNSVIAIGDFAFAACESLTSFTFPTALTYASSWMLYNCTNLTSLVVPDTITYINKGAFENTGISELTVGLDMLENVVHNGEMDKSKITKLALTSGTLLKSLSSYTNLETLLLPDDIESTNVEVIDYNSKLTFTEYKNAKYLGNETNKYLLLVSVIDKTQTSFEFAEGVRVIYDNAFKEMPLTSIDLPNTLITVGRYAFKGCNGIEHLTIPASVKNMQESSFRECTGLTDVTFENESKLVAPTGSMGVFTGCTSLESVTCPAEFLVTNQGSGASSTLPKNKLTTIVVTSGTVIPDNAFRYLDKLSSLTLPNSITEIGRYAFSGCESLKSIVIPGKVERLIEDSLFDNFVESITISEGVKRIEDSAIAAVSGQNLTELYLPSSLEYLGFIKTTSLEVINYAGTLEMWDNLEKGTFPYSVLKKVVCIDGEKVYKS